MTEMQKITPSILFTGILKSSPILRGFPKKKNTQKSDYWKYVPALFWAALGANWAKPELLFLKTLFKRGSSFPAERSRQRRYKQTRE